MIKDIKVSSAVEAAQKAARGNRSVLVYRQNVPWSKSGWSGEVGDMGEVVEAIEAQGWRLDHMAYDGQQSSNGSCLLLFRRDRHAAPAPPPAAPQLRQQPAEAYEGPWPPRR